MSAGGQAAPPITTRFRERSRSPRAARYCVRPSHTVGTPSAALTPSSSMSACSVAGSPSFGPGNTSLVPAIGQACAVPQPLAWKSGTMGITHSRAESAKTSGSAVPRACSTIARCE